MQKSPSAAPVERFEDLKVWKAARLLVSQIYRVTSRGQYERDFALRNQTRRAAVSVMSNIAEGFERDGNRELIQFLALAKGSSGETRSHLCVAADQGYISSEEFHSLSVASVRLSKMIATFMMYLRGSEVRGRKFPNDTL